MSVVRQRIAVLCGQITRHADMEQAIRRVGGGPHLDRILGAVRGADAPDPGKLIELLDELEDVCGEKGLAGITTTSKQYVPLPRGFQGSDPDEPPTWVCPLKRCSRVVFEDEAPVAPSCATAGTPMSSIRIP
ncbi:hypothetical protein [Kitasatospora indigofera]|uniref:hypothetical protein n=1 Tax=Kitasatospora indigofera TaxID=67307 RepID=UPI003243F27D